MVNVDFDDVDPVAVYFPRERMLPGARVALISRGID
jgi:hypothetical protein